MFYLTLLLFCFILCSCGSLEYEQLQKQKEHKELKFRPIPKPFHPDKYPNDVKYAFNENAKR